MEFSDRNKREQYLQSNFKLIENELDTCITCKGNPFCRNCNILLSRWKKLCNSTPLQDEGKNL